MKRPQARETKRAKPKKLDGFTAQTEAEHHRHTRRAHLTELAEDYVELVSHLIATNGEARAVEIARRLGVTHVTVAKTISRLQRAGLVTTRPYRSIFLTEAGSQLAQEAHRRHQIVVRFLQAIGVREDIARADAEGIEHHVSRETLAAFERFCWAKPS